MVLVNCLKKASQIAARMKMLKKGVCMQWCHLVYSDLPSQGVEILSDLLLLLSDNRLFLVLSKAQQWLIVRFTYIE